jgi:hypothetical protein
MRKLALVTSTLIAASIGALASSGSASADGWYCSDWDSGGACTRQTSYEWYGSWDQLLCATTIAFMGNIGGIDRWEITEVNCSFVQ